MQRVALGAEPATECCRDNPPDVERSGAPIERRTQAARREGRIHAELDSIPASKLGDHVAHGRVAEHETARRPRQIVTRRGGALYANGSAGDCHSTITGVADNEDVDYYQVEAKKGERLTAEVEGIRLGITFFDPYVAIMDAGRFELAASDDSALLWQDAVASILVPEDGKYVVQVRESSFAGNGSCAYRLHVGRFPRPTAVLPAGGKLNEPVTVRFLGDACAHVPAAG